MIVRCANCNTEFSLDDRQVGPEGATVRCSVCSHVFHVEPPGASLASQPWQIRTVEDLVFTAPNLDTLRQWIAEGRLHPDDKISRTGKHWVRLGDMPEFSGSFAGFQGLPQVVTPVAPAEQILDDLTPPPPPAFSESSVPMPEVVAAAEEPPKPTSMLDAVTQAVAHAPGGGARTMIGVGPSGGTTAPVPEPPPFAGEAKPEPTPSPAPIPAPEPSVPQPGGRPIRAPAPSPDSRDAGLSSSMMSPAPRRPSNWLLIAGLGAVVGVGVMFGIGPVRDRLFGVAGDVVGTEAKQEAKAPEPVPDPESVASAHRAIMLLDPREMARAEASLQSAIDDGAAPAPAIASMQLAQVELLSARAIELAILHSHGGDSAGDAGSQSRGYAERATRIFDAIDVKQLQDRARLKTARGLLRLAHGRGADEILPLLPESGAEEARLLVDASPVWLDEDGKLDDGVTARLGQEPASGLAQLALATAYERGGDRPAAVAVVDKFLEGVAEQPTAAAIKAILSGEAPPPLPAVEDKGQPPEQPPEQPTKPEPTPDAPSDKPKPAGGGSSGGSGAGMSTEKLIDRGCTKVDAGDAPGGVKLLMEAFDRKPNDLDVLVCLAQGYSKLGNLQSATAFYKRALDRSPQHRSALRGAAKTAARLGQTAKAVKLYERLLKIEPGDAEARSYVKTHGGGGGDPPSKPPEAKAPAG